jgi:hypothetical protein
VFDCIFDYFVMLSLQEAAMPAEADRRSLFDWLFVCVFVCFDWLTDWLTDW